MTLRRRRRTTLRSALGLAMVALLAIALGRAAALAVLTSRLHRATIRLGTAMENVRLAEESLIDLRAIDGVVAGLDDAGAEDARRLRETASRRTDALRARLVELLRRADSPAVRELLTASRASVERIFEPFRRGSRLTGTVPGLGLGLSTARRIAERHGGTLTASSSARRGATFELRLPAVALEPPAPGPALDGGAAASCPAEPGRGGHGMAGRAPH
jgi:hypothetical protein